MDPVARVDRSAAKTGQSFFIVPTRSNNDRLVSDRSQTFQI